MVVLDTAALFTVTEGENSNVFQWLNKVMAHPQIKRYTRVKMHKMLIYADKDKKKKKSPVEEARHKRMNVT